MRLVRYDYLNANGLVPNRATLRRWILDYGFPEPIHLGPNTRAWDLDAVEQWVRERARPSAESRRVAERNRANVAKASLPAARVKAKATNVLRKTELRAARRSAVKPHTAQLAQSSGAGSRKSGARPTATP